MTQVQSCPSGLTIESMRDSGSSPGLGRFHMPRGSWTCGPQPLSHQALEPVLHRKQEKPPQQEAQARPLEKAWAQLQRPSTSQNK